MQSKTPLSDSFPAGMQAAARDLTGFAAPLILARVFRAAAGIVRPEKKFRSIRRSISESGATKAFPQEEPLCMQEVTKPFNLRLAAPRSM